jgi:protein-L-isoaspartate(D-aspartate) O-methyltransferase
MNERELYEFFNRLDRSFFLEGDAKSFADYDGPLSIGYGQTISQPSLVAYMTKMLDVRSNSNVLEIGTGSGYQTAFLAHFGKMVYTVERIGDLSEKAQKRLSLLGYNNIEYLIGDGSKGWIENAPFDRIMVTAAARHVPEALTDQLALGGIMIIPAGEGAVQSLLRVEKSSAGELIETELLKVRFVDLIGDY